MPVEISAFPEADRDTELDLHNVLMQSFLTVAADFGLTGENSPTNPAFRPPEAVKQDMARGARYLLAREDGNLIGCIAIEQNRNDPDMYFIERVAVLPECRHKGYGKALLDAAMAEIGKLGGKTVSIGIIDENKVLKNWYSAYGFTETGTKNFDHLPFAVCFMKMDL